MQRHEVVARALRLGDQVYRDIVVPFDCQRRDYLGSCRFSNTVEKFGVKSSAIKGLENGHKGYRLKLQSESGREFEVEVRDGGAKLGLVRPRQPRLLLAEGSASSESSRQRFSEIIRQQEGK